MNRTMYFLRKENMKSIKKKLDSQYNLELCFKNKNEMILKNNELLISCKNKYISVVIYNNSSVNLAYKVQKLLGDN